ncbi:hypothetical protein [Paenibacillus sp. FSL W7-1332]|uniref:hypothetical protein n=1 Tax=Paenibacillus sp. FSL W7-1332 TaxID=2921702 RepID=UPI0030CD69D7
MIITKYTPSGENLKFIYELTEGKDVAISTNFVKVSPERLNIVTISDHKGKQPDKSHPPENSTADAPPSGKETGSGSFVKKHLPSVYRL